MKSNHENYCAALRALVVTLCVGLCCAAVAAQEAVQPVVQEQVDRGWVAWFFENYILTFVIICGFAALLVYRARKNRRPDAFSGKISSRFEQPREVRAPVSPKASAPVVNETENSRPQSAKEAAASDSQAAFGAYRIDQEVGKLVLGKPHRADVLASRVSDDRRSIEASLVKALSASENDNNSRERARRALDDYGFVARQCALLLQGRDAWERSSAARVLGQIASPVSLPALLEALHDGDSIVRNQVVTSLGQLKHPAAIGALLDIARRYSDIPAALLSESLTACSVADLGFLDSGGLDFHEPMSGLEGDEQDMDSVFAEQLPIGDEDDVLLGLLTKLEGSDDAERAQVVRDLGTHRAQRSVEALCSTALNDTDASVRAAAVAALGAIDHESVFAPVLIALADDTREVRASAARTLSSLHFDRAEAYTRVMRNADLKTLRDFARACVTTGIAAQAVDRLASEDRRHAHEAFALFSVLAKAGEIQPILDTIEKHREIPVQLAAVRVLGSAADSAAAPRLRELVAGESMPEDVRTAILELLYKFDKEPAAV